MKWSISAGGDTAVSEKQGALDNTRASGDYTGVK